MFERQILLIRDRAGNIKQFTRHSLSEWNTVHFYSLVTDFTREFSTNALGIEMFERQSLLNRDRAGNIEQVARHSAAEWNTVHFDILVTNLTREVLTADLEN